MATLPPPGPLCYPLDRLTVRRVLVHLAAILAYVGCATLFTWPLAARLQTHLPGPPTGDTGVYVWNAWVFQQQILQKSWPFVTTRILGLADGANLALENYTVFQDLLALPLITVVGAVGAFNLVLLGMTVLSAYGMFLLARQDTGHVRAAWLAGLVFAWSPVLVARSTAHASLVAAGALPFFAMAVGRLQRRPTVAAGALTGLTIAWATYCDVYYGVFCVLLGATLVVGPRLTLERRERTHHRVGRLLDLVILVVALIYVTIGVTGGASLRLGGVVIHARTLYGPALVLVVLGLARLATLVRVRGDRPAELVAPGMRAATAALLLTTATLLSPLIVAVLRQFADRDPTGTATLWRSSPPGVDLLAFVLPNPNSPWFGAGVREWLTAQSGAFVENAASLPWIALAFVVGPVFFSRQLAAPRRWVGVGAVFAALALGPFIHVGGFNTCIPGPWALLRFLPVVGLARTPSRFSVVVTLALCVLFAHAVADLARRRPRLARVALAAVAIVVALEINPAPRQLYAADVSSVYRIIAADPRDVRVMELPFGLRDGTQSVGNFRTVAQFAQIVHGKGLVGAYLSRLPRRAVRHYLRRPTTAALMTLSAGGSLSPQERAYLVRRGYAFVHRTRLAYVVMTPELVSPELEQFAIEAFGLERVAADEQRVLYRTFFDESALIVYGQAALREYHPAH